MKKIIEFNLKNEESCDGCPYLHNGLYYGDYDYSDVPFEIYMCGLNYLNDKTIHYMSKGKDLEQVSYKENLYQIKRPISCKNSIGIDILKTQKEILSIEKPTDGVIENKLCDLISDYLRK